MRKARPELKRTARIFAIGSACGFVAGAALVAILITRYGHPAPVATPREASGSATADGLADIDTPVLRGDASRSAAPAGTTGRAPAVLTPAPPETLTRRRLEIPVEGIKPEQLVRSFDEKRGSTRAHEAIDILAPKGTPVKAVEEGTVARLFESKAGGITIYQFDPAEQFCYYYAHLDRYADGLREGDKVRKGQVIGFVGTSGNAPKNTPHLHFAVFKLTAAKHWWEGDPIDPYDILR